MKQGQRLELRQGQTLAMTPQLRQAIAILQMSATDLADYLASELERNPFLEIAGPASAREEVVESSPDKAPASEVDEKLSTNSLSAAEDTFDTGVENLYADQSLADKQSEQQQRSAEGGFIENGSAELGFSWSTVGKGGSSKFEDSNLSIEATLAASCTLREHLLNQLSLTSDNKDVLLVATYLIDCLDDAGYLKSSLDNVGERLGTTDDVMQRALQLVQSLEPSGVGARSLQECLSLQLQELDRLDPAMQAMLDNLSLLADGDLKSLEKICGVTAEDIRDMVVEIRHLHPKPGLQFGSITAQTLIPDVIVSRNPAGGWNVELNPEAVPRAIIDRRYMTQVGNNLTNSAQEWLNERKQSASWLVRSLDQRARTIVKVASEIVRRQDSFFHEGISAMRPLTLKMVAEDIDMHESTVSRVTSNKFMQTERGIFEMKYFFTAGIGSTDGSGERSSQAVRHVIKRLIEAETCEKVLSDDQIVSELKKQGIDIARRTVAKYREAMDIPSSVRRRKLLKIAAAQS